jgi:hypothetical protein
MLVFLVFGACVIFLFWLADRADRRSTFNKNNPCVKQPDKQCSYVITADGKGGFKAEGHMKCCQVRDRMKAHNEAFCNMIPGKTYGDIKITEAFHKDCLANKIRYDEMDTSGPAE